MATPRRVCIGEAGLARKAALRLLHPGSGRVLAERLEKPRTFFGRGLGLMFRRALPAGEGMWIAPCNGIHMFWMNFPIDAIFLDKQRRVVKAYPNLGVWRMIPIVFGADSVVELPAGTIVPLALERGEQLSIESTSGE